MLKIKNSADNPVNLNEHLDKSCKHYNKYNQIIDLGIQHDVFGKFPSNFSTTFTGVSMLGVLNYSETYWPSNSPLRFEAFPDDSRSKNYLFSYYPF